MAQSADNEDEKPLDPAVERVRRRVMRFIAINLGILFVALMAVAIAIVYRLGSRTETPPAEIRPFAIPNEDILAEGRISLPAGARVLSQSVSGTRLSLHIALVDGGQQILIYDLASDAIAGRFSIAIQP